VKKISRYAHDAVSWYLEGKKFPTSTPGLLMWESPPGVLHSSASFFRAYPRTTIAWPGGVYRIPIGKNIP